MLSEGLRDNISLFYLNIAKNEITENGIEALSQVLASTQLEELDVSCNDLGNVGIAELANALSPIVKKKNPLRCSLNTLNISECNFQYAGAFRMFKALKDYKNIQTLILDRNQFAGKNAMKMNQFKEVLYKTRIERLSINSCKLGE